MPAHTAPQSYKPSEMTKEECIAVLDSGVELNNVQRHWLQVKAGLKAMPEDIGKRGKDLPTSPRQVRKKVSVAQRYYEITGGRSIEQDMKTQQQMIQLMFDEASAIDSAEKRFKALAECQRAQSDFNRTWLPYLEVKLGTMKTETTVEEMQDWESLINAPVIEGDK